MINRDYDITNAKGAREFIADFEIPGTGKPDYVQTTSGRTIMFATMTDEESIEVAHMLYKMHCQAEKNQAERAGAIQ